MLCGGVPLTRGFGERMINAITSGCAQGRPEHHGLPRISILTLVRRQYTPALPEYHVFPR